MKIRIVDTNPDRYGAWMERLTRHPGFDVRECGKYHPQAAELDRELAVWHPDVLLCHANDVYSEEQQSFAADWIAAATKGGALVVLYSGGGVKFERSLESKSVTISTNIISKAEVSDCNPERIFAVPHSVLKSQDLPMDAAAQISNDAQQFVNELMQFDPLLEIKLELLYSALSGGLEEFAKKLESDTSLAYSDKKPVLAACRRLQVDANPEILRQVRDELIGAY